MSASASRTARIGGRVLRNRRLVRAPIGLYRAGLGFLLGSRLLMVEHIGRTSGARRYVVLEVLTRPDPATYVIASGFGEKAQWYRNLRANPSARVWVGARRAVPATARHLSDTEADAVLADYRTHHAPTWEKLRPVLEDTLGHPVERGADLPMVALELHG
ncbi:nitroreductase family deazaflavin-dependent oxidoreductase [Actinotalea sp. M2MS4P-6]|uniref:nitroreductase family deazaflavin-dependent oxidoreductase n=1 Tax=Actinotalea sp. M2MS4P-6 TaxID=2983762 RepID=UPI0021E4BA10|nr:nitroreductase family deazaflavin-dependent oxidoreductase [Actinotalea sp. M2MS4P-6]MCV2393634.1 nitroreductase family deazaflavin-dependent oxidoreductase [Actinotalea sp. M2MS4P-6]